MNHQHEQSAEMKQCIDNCTACHQICLRCIPHCLMMGGEHASPDHIRIMADCAQICAVSADFMLRGSGMHARVCGVCAEACRRCADDCARLAKGDKMMNECADLCRRCAESCVRMEEAGMRQ
jgi:hypothetical protein